MQVPAWQAKGDNMPAMRSPLIVLGGGLLLAALACSAPIAASPTETSKPTATFTATPTATATFTPTPTSTPSPALRLDAGRQALRNGDWDLALLEFDRVLEQTEDPALAGEARFGRGQALLWSGNIAEAERVFWRFLSDYRNPGHARLGQAYLHQAEIALQVGDVHIAIEDYQNYLALMPGVIDSYVEEWFGDALRQRGQPLDAIPHYETAINSPRAGDTLPILVKIGVAYLEAGQLEQAIAQFDVVSSIAQDPHTLATMNLLAADAYDGLGDLHAMYARLLDSVDRYPEAYDSYVGLIRLVNDLVPVDEFQRGLVDYYAGAYEPALGAFERSIQTAPSAAAYYYRGLSHLELGLAQAAHGDLEFVVLTFPGDPIWPEAMFAKARTEWIYLDRYSDAVDTYLALAAALPDSASAPEALFFAGRTAERINDLNRAAGIWLQLAEGYPGSVYGFEAAFLAGISLYRLSDYEGAGSAFGSARGLASQSWQVAAAQLWSGKVLQAQGQSEAASAAWAAAAEADPTGYYSVRAEELLAGQAPFSRSGTFDFSSDVQAERAEAESWLRANFNIVGPEPLSGLDQRLASDPRLIRAEELWRLGRLEQARLEFSQLRAAWSADAEATYRLMHKLLELELYREAIFAARHVLDLAGLDDAGTLSAPVYFNRIRFGPYFGELILPEAARYGFDGLFLLSVVRQESLFEGFATSYAAARGLMQVIPSTGESIASQLGWPPAYETEDLYRPVVSVRFGTFYLGQQRDRFEGDLYAALAAYNAGPGNSIIWKELAPDDPDLFLEIIRIDQPQIYIQVIYEVYEIYSGLYASE
jgi:soluble lytic murein transglycosylase